MINICGQLPVVGRWSSRGCAPIIAPVGSVLHLGRVGGKAAGATRPSTPARALRPWTPQVRLPQLQCSQHMPISIWVVKSWPVDGGSQPGCTKACAPGLGCAAGFLCRRGARGTGQGSPCRGCGGEAPHKKLEPAGAKRPASVSESKNPCRGRGGEAPRKRVV